MSSPRRWHEGKNTGRIVTFIAGIPRDKSHEYTVYEVTLNNNYGEQISFRYVVMHGKRPPELLTDLQHFSKLVPKPWFEINLKWNEKGFFQITGMKEITDKTQDEVELESLAARGGRVTLQ